ncbi:MAG: hypothetical protein CMP10_17420 [Zetaproteobacteria bacterium]|mgnify:CR=1 FL=1|nr:hypothetical protein [Pseudobdellovibrionaceae bacterium]
MITMKRSSSICFIWFFSLFWSQSVLAENPPAPPQNSSQPAELTEGETQTTTAVADQDVITINSQEIIIEAVSPRDEEMSEFQLPEKPSPGLIKARESIISNMSSLKDVSDNMSETVEAANFDNPNTKQIKKLKRQINNYGDNIKKLDAAKRNFRQQLFSFEEVENAAK